VKKNYAKVLKAEVAAEKITAEEGEPSGSGWSNTPDQLERHPIHKSKGNRKATNGEDEPRPIDQMHPSRRDQLNGRSQRRPRLSPDEIEALRQRRREESLAWNKRTAKGTPDIGARMNVLLARIERKLGRK